MTVLYGLIPIYDGLRVSLRGDGNIGQGGSRGKGWDDGENYTGVQLISSSVASVL
ncbi:hypothetical protein [Moorena sp. SIO4G3]|uniref:hypothetical protein n=1 Tax=Moorena sp. SIO4G3 TaxID=2607821 RepID=UPI00142C0F04|nr:hypothetical protein [Moorena sp. SIO4G3]NEO79626.1 hypothetical protein [Moorena sp. SIO4G3]